MYKIKASKSSSSNFNFMDDIETQTSVRDIINHVRTKGDQAVKELTLKYDGIHIDELQVDKSDLQAAYHSIPKDTKHAIEFAKEQIEFFAKKQLKSLNSVECENVSGVTLGHRIIPINSCGCYVPSGRYPLPSSALMSIIPAKVAGVERVVGIAPPTIGYKSLHPVVMAAMYIAGVDEVFIAGGAQAISSLTFGTETIPYTDIIVGPGNKYVTEAKRQVNGIVGIDHLAGPSEVLIIADDSAPVDKVAVDLLAQAEHDPGAISILVTTSDRLARQVNDEIKNKLTKLQTKDIASDSWDKYGEIIVVNDLSEAVLYSDDLAPEHLQLMTKANDKLMAQLKNFGSLFVGEYASIAFGDYVSGTNHILPTGGNAKFESGLWVGKFLKVSSYQKVTEEGAKQLLSPCLILSEQEGLFGHNWSAGHREE